MSTAGAEAPCLGPEYGPGSGRLWKLSEEQRKARDAIARADSQQDYEAVSCLCGGGGRDFLVSTVERHGLSCRNVICAQCGLIRISPRWKEARYNRFYENEYRDLYNRIEVSKETFTGSTARSPWVKGFGAWIRKMVDRHGKNDGPVRVLEIGAGAGWNLSNLPETWVRTGYDVDREYLDLGQKLFGLEMKFGLIEEALNEIPQQDVILLSHVVEHFMDPIAALASISARMKPNALLLIEVPGIFRIHRSALDPMTYLQNAHTFTFCAQTLKETCENASLSLLDIDETCRAVCKKSNERAVSPANPRLAPTVLRYLRMCGFGITVQRALRTLPLAGRYLAALWRRIYFPCLVVLVPPARQAK